MNRRIWIPVATGALLLLILGGAWAWRGRTAPEVTEMRDLTNRMFDLENVSAEEQVEIFQRMGEIKESIPEDQREEVYSQMKSEFGRAMDDHFRTFAALPEDQRDDFLDRDIDRMGAMKNAWDKGRRERSSGDKPKRDRKSAEKKRPKTEDERKARRRQRLDKRTAEQRAYSAEYKNAIKRRLIERGIEYFKGHKISK